MAFLVPGIPHILYSGNAVFSISICLSLICLPLLQWLLAYVPLPLQDYKYIRFLFIHSFYKMGDFSV